MDNVTEYNEEERRWIETYNSISAQISRQIREIDEEKRLLYLRETAPSDIQLMNLYLMGLKNEDYETCTPAKALLLERGIQIPH